MPHVHFDFINSFDLNACASKYNNNIYFIGVYKGTPLLIWDLFLRLLSNPNILKHIGNPSAEFDDSDPYPYQVTNFLQLKKIPDSNGLLHLQRNPKDVQRNRYAIHLIDLVNNFLIAHEMAHILYGHVGYIKEITSFSSFDEDFKDYKGIPLLDLQTLEFDADCFGVNQGIYTLVDYFKNKDKIPMDYRPFFKTFEDALFDWSFAIFTLFRILGPQNYKPEYFLKTKHPPSRIRQIIVIRCIAATVKKHLPIISEESIYKICGNAISECENAYAIITYNSSEAIGLKEALSETGEEHISKLIENWKTLRLELQKHNFKKLVQPSY